MATTEVKMEPYKAPKSTKKRRVTVRIEASAGGIMSQHKCDVIDGKEVIHISTRSGRHSIVLWFMVQMKAIREKYKDCDFDILLDPGISHVDTHRLSAMTKDNETIRQNKPCTKENVELFRAGLW
jgi:hypothetical protein